MAKYDEAQALNKVAEFHRTFNHPILETAGIPPEKRCKLRVALIAEELSELEGAIKNQDMVEVADALCDLQYVLSGAILEFGLGGKFQRLFDEVHRSNMSKSCKTETEANETVDYHVKEGTPCHYEASDGQYLVYRTEDNKTIKSVNYSPANLGAVLERA